MTNSEKQRVYIIGHKTPDTDSICAAISYAYFKNKTEPDKEFRAVKVGSINEETSFVLKHFNIEEPETLESAEGKTLILVDHNLREQSVHNVDKAKIMEILDHHEAGNLGEKHPDIFSQEQIGSTSTIIANKFFEKNIEIPKQIAGLLLSAILSDTVVFRAITTTDKDKEAAEELAKIVNITDLEEFGIEIKKQKADISEKTAHDILYSDFKDFDFSGNKVGVGQVEIVDLEEALKKKQEIIEKMKEVLEKESYDLLLFMLTDIIKQGTDLFAVGPVAKKVVKEALEQDLENDSVYVEGMMSRKKQIVKQLREYFGC